MKGGKILRFLGRSKRTVILASAAICLRCPAYGQNATEPKTFRLEETTIADIQAAYKSGQLTSHQLVQLYLDRIVAYDRKGPAINSIQVINPKALEEADKLDAAFQSSGLVGPLHGIPVILKDMIDAQGMATTFGSLMFKDFYPEKDAFVVEKLKKAGAIILGKATVAEFVGGDNYGSLFGATLNPYAPDRTAGGSSGGTGASVAANFATLGIGQENAASTRRPAAWNDVVGMRTTSSLISRTGSYGGWPSILGSLTPMTRTVTDLAKLLDVMVGYDPEDPLTALGVGNIPNSYTKFLDPNGLKGARIGVIREALGDNSRLPPEDYKNVNEVFEKALDELKAAGAELVDPLVIPRLKELLAKRVRGPEEDESFVAYFARHPNAPYKSRTEIIESPEFTKVFPEAQQRLRQTYTASPEEYYQYLLARQELTIIILKGMADKQLDALLYKSMDGPPPLIQKGPTPSSAPGAGPPTLNTFLVFAPAITVPAGFTRDNLPVGITFQGRPYADGVMIKLAYAYEQATRHRKPPVLDMNAR